MMISIKATKKGRLSVEHEKRKHWLVTKIRNVSGCDDAIVALCSRISKRLGAQARERREKEKEKKSSKFKGNTRRRAWKRCSRERT